MDRLFTEYDLKKGRCTEDEVGKPWEDRWGNEAYADPKIPFTYAMKPKATHLLEEQKLEERLMQLGGVDKLQALFHHDPEYFCNAYPPAIVGKVLEIDKEVTAKAEIGRDAIKEISTRQLQNMSTFQRMVSIVNILCYCVAEDKQQDMLTYLGIDKRDIADMLLEYSNNP